MVGISLGVGRRSIKRLKKAGKNVLLVALGRENEVDQGTDYYKPPTGKNFLWDRRENALGMRSQLISLKGET